LPIPLPGQRETWPSNPKPLTAVIPSFVLDFPGIFDTASKVPQVHFHPTMLPPQYANTYQGVMLPQAYAPSGRFPFPPHIPQVFLIETLPTVVSKPPVPLQYLQSG